MRETARASKQFFLAVVLALIHLQTAQPFSLPRNDLNAVSRGRTHASTVLFGSETLGGDREIESPPAPSTFFRELSSRFRGDFDNYDQVLSDRRAGLLPREGGGHEHIHCTLVPIDVSEQLGRHLADGTRQARLAAFYFDGLPERIFRFRLYALQTGEDDESGATCAMTLYTLGPETEGRLRQLAGRPTEWGAALERHLETITSEEGDGGGVNVTPPPPPVKELGGCDVLWTPDPDPDRHAYAYGHSVLDPDDAYHAVMVDGEATIPSLMNPGTLIRVVDELSLWSDEFWINDRGFDPGTGSFVYGNQRGVPYKMRRVTSIDVGTGEKGTGKARLNVVDDALAWTLGEEWRTFEEYEGKMSAIGGTSARMNAPGKPPR